MSICWTAWRTLVRSTHPQRCALEAGGLTSECLRMRMTCADGVRSSRVAHGAMGTEGSNWRVGNPHGGQTRRAAGGQERWTGWLTVWVAGWDMCGERHLRQAQGHTLTWPGEPRGVDGSIHTNWLEIIIVDESKAKKMRNSKTTL